MKRMIDRFYVTTKGENLLAKAQGGAELRFTKIKVGDGVLPSGQSIQSLLDMISPKATFGISDKSVSGSSAVVTIMFTNQGITTGFLWREVGLYALDPTEGEILYAFGYDNVTPIKIESASVTAMSFTYGMQTIIKNAANITAMIDPSAQFLKRDELAKYVAMEKGESGQTVVTFTEQSSASVEEIVSGARLGVLIGKFKKMVSDLVNFRDRPSGFATAAQGSKADAALPATAQAADSAKLGGEPAEYYAPMAVVNSKQKKINAGTFILASGTSWGSVNGVYQQIVNVPDLPADINGTSTITKTTISWAYDSAENAGKFVVLLYNQPAGQLVFCAKTRPNAVLNGMWEFKEVTAL